MLTFQNQQPMLVGEVGQLPVRQDDEVTQKLAMLFEGQCETADITAVVRKFGYSRQRYYQLLQKFHAGGAVALQNQKTGPKHNYRRTQEVVRQVIRHLFLDREASPEVVAQKLRQLGNAISVRSVQRVVAEYGLQKKTPRGGPQDAQRPAPHLPHAPERPDVAAGPRAPRAHRAPTARR